MPELLTVIFSAIAGLLSTSIYNILTSNIINLVQYIMTVFSNKNQRILGNKALKIDLTLVLFTIIIPLSMMLFKIKFQIEIIPIFILLCLLFYYINYNSHKLYLEKQSKQIEEKKWLRGKTKLTIKYLFLLIITSIILYLVGNLLSNVLENLAQIFNVPEVILGIVLGFITSIPELITFYESQKHYNNQSKIELGVVEATNNLLTSNLMNLFVIQSIGILIYSMLFV